MEISWKAKLLFVAVMAFMTTSAILYPVTERAIRDRRWGLVRPYLSTSGQTIEAGPSDVSMCLQCIFFLVVFGVIEFMDHGRFVIAWWMAIFVMIIGIVYMGQWVWNTNEPYNSDPGHVYADMILLQLVTMKNYRRPCITIHCIKQAYRRVIGYVHPDKNLDNNQQSTRATIQLSQSRDHLLCVFHEQNC